MRNVFKRVGNVLRRIYKLWMGVGDALHEITLAVTFLSFIPVALFTMYYLLLDFNLPRVIAGAIVFRVMVKCNIDL